MGNGAWDGDWGLGWGASVGRDGGATWAASEGPRVGGTPKELLKPQLWCCRKPLRAFWDGQAQGVSARGGYPHAWAMGTGRGEDASPPSAPFSPTSKLSVSPGVLEKATRLHEHVSWLGSGAMPSPGGTGTPMAPVCTMQLALSPWVLARSAMTAPAGWRDAPQPPGRWGATLRPPHSGSPHRSPWYSQGSPGEVPLPLGVQDLLPSWWLVDAYFSPSPTMRALPSGGDRIESPIRRHGYILCHAGSPAGTGGVGAVGHCLLPCSSQEPCRSGEEPFPTANTAGGSGASGGATNALKSRNCRGRFG